MFSAASKLYLTLGVLAVVAGFASVVATSDRTGFTLLVVGGLAAVTLGVGSFVFTRKEALPSPGAAAEVAAVDAADVARASLWPVVVAVAVAVLGVGAALGGSLVVIGLVLSAVAGLGWLGQAWSEHPAWTQRQSDRLWDRYVAPIGLPVTVAVCVALLGVAVSRLLLSMSKDFAPLIAIVVAFAILGVAFLLSTLENVGRQALAVLAMVTGVLVVGAGVAGAVKGERDHESEAGAGVEIALVARSDRFATNQVALPANAAVVIRLVNESGRTQNLSIYNHKGGTALVTGEAVQPGKSGRVSWTTPGNGNGTYYFQSDSNPDQFCGAVTIVKSETTAPGASAGTPSPTTTAQG